MKKVLILLLVSGILIALSSNDKKLLVLIELDDGIYDYDTETMIQLEIPVLKINVDTEDYFINKETFDEAVIQGLYNKIWEYHPVQRNFSDKFKSLCAKKNSVFDGKYLYHYVVNCPKKSFEKNKTTRANFLNECYGCERALFDHYYLDGVYCITDKATKFLKSHETK